MGHIQKGSVPLVGATVQPFAHEKSPNCFLISHTSNGKDFLMYTDTDTELAEWLGLLRAAASGIGVISPVSPPLSPVSRPAVPPKPRSVTFTPAVEMVDVELRHSILPGHGPAIVAAIETAEQEQEEQEVDIELRHSVVPTGFTPAVIRQLDKRSKGNCFRSHTWECSLVSQLGIGIPWQGIMRWKSLARSGSIHRACLGRGPSPMMRS